jgi:hypothetical protein
MVLFGRKLQSDRRELLASMNQMAVGKPVDNGEFSDIIMFCFPYFTVDILMQLVSKERLVFEIFKQANAGKR